MKKITKYISIVVLMLMAAVSQAKDHKLILNLDEAMRSLEAKKVLLPNIKVSFASGGGKIVAKDLVSNKKTNSFNKSNEAACRRALLSAVKSFQERAVKMNATRVVNLVSYYDKNVYKSTTKYECHAGNFVAGVVLKGDIAK